MLRQVLVGASCLIHFCFFLDAGYQYIIYCFIVLVLLEPHILESVASEASEIQESLAHARWAEVLPLP